jgi:hypothetical protein
LEQEGNLNSLHLMCSGCLVSHEHCWFTSSEQQKGPRERRCIGHLRRVRHCQHASDLRFKEIMRWPRIHDWFHPLGASFTVESHHCWRQNSHAALQYPSNCLFLRHTREFILSRQYLLLTVPKYTHVALEDIWMC